MMAMLAAPTALYDTDANRKKGRCKTKKATNANSGNDCNRQCRIAEVGKIEENKNKKMHHDYLYAYNRNDDESRALAMIARTQLQLNTALYFILFKD